MLTLHAQKTGSLLAVLLTLILGCFGCSPSESEEELSQVIASGMEALDMPGLAVAVVEDNEITLAQGFGRRDDAGHAVTAQTPFQIGSVSKSFTALIVLQLVAEGRFGIDDPVAHVVPAFRMADLDHAKAVTFRHLMNHTSGFSTADGNRSRGDGEPKTTEAAVRALSNAQPVASPGAQFHYSNANYVVLGHAIEVVEQMPYEDVLDARVFSKLGMVNSYGNLPEEQAVGEARGHSQWFGIPRQNRNRPDPARLAAGGIYASADDMAKYLQALLAKDPRIVPPALSHQWDDASFVGYAFGWQHAVVDGKRAILHDGLTPGFRTRAMLLPDEGRAAVLLTNMSGTLDANLYAGLVHKALGLPAAPLQSTGMMLLIWGSLAGTLLFLLGCLRNLWQTFELRHTPWTRPEPLRWLVLVLPPVALVSGALALLTFVPRSLGLDFRGTWVYFPDLAAMLLTMATTAVVWAAALPLLIAKRPKAPLAR